MTYTKEEVAPILLRANRMLDDHRIPAEDVVATLEPLHNCTNITGMSEKNRMAAVSMIYALTADAYRKEHNFAEAAIWYRKASEFSPGGHAEIFAHMVCKNELKDFYRDAYTILLESKVSWERRNWFERAYLTIMAWRWWFDPEGREISFSKKRNLEFLEKELNSN